MANQVIYQYSTQIVAASDTNTVPAGSFSVASASVALTSANHFNYPMGDFSLFHSATASVSSASNTVLLFRRDINIDSTNDGPVPITSTISPYSNTFVGAFTVPAYTGATSSYISLTDIPITKECEFYLQNSTSQPIAANWVLKFTPKTWAPGA